MQKRSKLKEESKAMHSSVKFKICPIEVAIGILGKKWTLLILRDMALLKINRFNLSRRLLPGPDAQGSHQEAARAGRAWANRVCRHKR
jgi:DNA-binding HxlR family transcriptional regulator